MARETNYVSQYGYQLYDTTGTLDDYIYGGLGAFSYTPEIGKENFHPQLRQRVHPGVRRPAAREPRHRASRRAESSAACARRTLLAAETAVDAGSHSVIRGTAPAGRTLRLTRTVITYPHARAA